jgi:lipoate-protein ligase A
MAIDEVLLERAAGENRAHLRIYRWDEPTVSLGYFQGVVERDTHPPSARCAIVRRPTGGGAIVHDLEITYALALPGAWHPIERRDLYHQVHGSLAEVLRHLNVAASVYAGSRQRAGAREPFLCFQRREPGDVVVGDGKVIGSAQRRGQRSLLQHGSILIKKSSFAPELAGIEDLSPTHLADAEWVNLTLNGLMRAIDSEAAYEPLSSDEERAACELVEGKYGRTQWAQRR